MTWQTVFDATLENDRVRLRPLRASDKEALRKIVFDPAIWRYFVATVDDEAGLDAFMETALADMAAERRAVFVIFDKATDELVGSMCYGNMAEKDLRLEIGWSWLGVAYQGTGLNRFAKLALLTHAFETLGCKRVEFKTDVLNQQARRGLRNIGATEEGVLRSYNFMPGGRRRDTIFYSILEDEWPKVKAELGAMETT
ncbi:GNAT family protein [Breoghania sp.]|uniref:GNAT family N-acetyltransferase n=1 Tax=Breoghania sp. TaxID=2065378 RepID=UPI002AAAC8E1|nr:GNAT family protein [Breoghania sp.]